VPGPSIPAEVSGSGQASVHPAVTPRLGCIARFRRVNRAFLLIQSCQSRAPPISPDSTCHEALPSVTQVTSRCAQQPANNPAIAVIGQVHGYRGIQFGPISSRSTVGVAQGAELVKRFTQSGPALIFTR